MGPYTNNCLFHTNQCIQLIVLHFCTNRSIIWRFIGWFFPTIWTSANFNCYVTAIFIVLDRNGVRKIRDDHVCDRILGRILLFDCINGYAGKKVFTLKDKISNQKVGATTFWFSSHLITQCLSKWLCKITFSSFDQGVHQRDCIARCTWFSVGHTENCRPFGHIDIVFVGRIFGLASIGNARFDSANVTFLDCDLHTRNAKLSCTKWARRWGIQVCIQFKHTYIIS